MDCTGFRINFSRLIVGLALVAASAGAANICDPATGTNCAQVAAPGSGASTTQAMAVRIVPKATYSSATALANAGLVVAAASTAPYSCLTGSASKTVIVQRIYLAGASLTAVAYLTHMVSKYSTAATGGTQQAMTAISNDSNNPAPSATVNAWTAAPTVGTLVGAVSSKRTLGQATTAAAAGVPDVLEFDFRSLNETSGIVLRGTTQQLCTHFGAAPASAVSIAVRYEWTEQATTLEP